MSCPRPVWSAVTLGLWLALQCACFQLFGCIIQMSACPTRARGWRVFIKLFWLQVTESNSSQRKLEEESSVRMLGTKGTVTGGGERRAGSWKERGFPSPSLLLLVHIHYPHFCTHPLSLFLPRLRGWKMTSHGCLVSSTSNSAPRLKSVKESDWLSLGLVANGLE